jgi:hypothetical protein
VPERGVKQEANLVIQMPNRTSLPTFQNGHFFAVAYIAGRYSPPGPKLGPPGFLGLYFAKAPEHPRYSFHTFALDGRQLAYSVVSSAEASLEFAMICGLIHYDVPLGQWRPFPANTPEKQALRKARLVSDYDRERRLLGAVLYQARARLMFRLPEVAPMFRAKLRSESAIRRDAAEREEVLRSVGLRPHER